MNDLNENQNIPFFDKLTQNDIMKLSIDIIPSFIYITLISLVIYSTDKIYYTSFVIVLKTLLFIFTLFILKGLFHSFCIATNKITLSHYKISIITMDFILNVCYYISIILSYLIFSGRPHNSFIKNIYITSLVFSITLIGIINLIQEAINLLMIIICFPIMVYNFISDPIEFYSTFGVSPEIVNNLPTIKADKNHCKECVICTEDINEGEEILVLKCPGNHFFHSNCVKQWLMQNFSCPLCRSKNIL